MKEQMLLNRDWTGSKRSVFANIGSSHHTAEDREANDYYATDPAAIDLLFAEEDFGNIWECACGEGHLSKRMIELGKHVKSTDLIDRGFGDHGIDFLKTQDAFDGDIITNPPYKFATEFINHALSLIPEGRKVAMFLKVQFLEGKARKLMFQRTPPKTIYVSSSRINCAKNGDFEGLRTTGGSAVAFAWWVWEKGFQGITQIKWIN